MSLRQTFFTPADKFFFSPQEVKASTDRTFMHSIDLNVYFSESAKHFSCQASFNQNGVRHDGNAKNKVDYFYKFYTNDPSKLNKLIDELVTKFNDVLDFRMDKLNIKITTDNGVLVDVSTCHKTARELFAKSIESLKEEVNNLEYRTPSRRL